MFLLLLQSIIYCSCLYCLFDILAESKTNLEDEDRIELCKNLKSIAGEREIILNNTDVSVADGVELYWTLTDVGTFYI